MTTTRSDQARSDLRGPLTGIRVLEIGGIGPGPFAGMMLADMGADVVRVDRPASGQSADDSSAEILHRGRRSIAIDLKTPQGIELVLRLAESADAMFEPYRPGVVERLGIEPEACLARNPRLVYGRMTGWGQDGPYAQSAGHDINYIALSGALGSMGGADKPVPPLNLVGDFGGGGMYLAFGIVCGLVEAMHSGQGQVVDAAMVDGAASLLTFFHGRMHAGEWHDERGTNFLDGGAWFYDTYETSDHRFVCVGAIEREFRRTLLRGLEVADVDLPKQWDRASWPAMKDRVAAIFASKTQSQWCEIFEGTDACFAPVLSLTEAPKHPHNQARDVFVTVEGITQPAPAPRFSRTPGQISSPPPVAGQDSRGVLSDWLGLENKEMTAYRDSGAVHET